MLNGLHLYSAFIDQMATKALYKHSKQFSDFINVKMQQSLFFTIDFFTISQDVNNTGPEALPVSV